MTHICLISGQLAPNLLSVLKLEPKSVVLVHTEATKKQADHFGGIIQKRYGVQEVIKKEVLPFNPLAIREAAEDLVRDLQGIQIMLNYTGGTKPMAIEFVRTLEAQDAALMYADTQQECFWLTKNGEVTKIPFNFRFSLQSLIDLKEVTIKSQADGRMIREMEPLTEFLFQEKTSGRKTPVIELCDRAVHFRVKQKSINHWRPGVQNSPLNVKIRSTDKISVALNGKPFPQKKKTFWLEYFSGGWFEQWCYSVLNHSGFFDDIHCNIKIKPESQTHPDHLKNEIDVAAIANGIPLFVECKTGNIDQKSITNLKAVRDFYGPKYSQGILVSLKPQQNEVLREKISDYGLGLAEGPENLKEKIIEISEQMIVKV